MPPFLRLIPLPRRLTTEIPTPIAAGIGLVVSLPATAARLAVTLPQTAVGAGLKLAGRYQELASLGTAVLALRGGGKPESDDEEDFDFPEAAAYSLDTSAWGAADSDAEVIALLAEPDDDHSVADNPVEGLISAVEESLDDEDAGLARVTDDEPASPVPDVLAADETPGAQQLAAAIADRTDEPATTPARKDLPVEAYDGLSATALRSRVGGLSAPQLRMLRDYEAGHARRVTVLAMLERAIGKAGPTAG